MKDTFSLNRTAPPFTRQDVFAYLVPGATLVVLVYLFEFWCTRVFMRQHADSIRAPIYTAFNSTALTDDNWAATLVYLLAALVFSYVLGHLVAWVSVFFIDRILIAKGHGYPWRNLLGFPRTSSPRVKIKRYAYPALFFALNLYFAARYFATFVNTPGSHRTASAFGWLALSLVLFKFLVTPSLGHYLPRTTAIIWKTFWFPYGIITRYLGRITRTTEPLRPAVVRAFKQRFVDTFGVPVKDAGNGAYWFPRIFVREHSARFDSLVVYYHHLYSFTRNLATAFYLAFLYCWISLTLQNGATVADNKYNLILSASVPALMFLASFALLSRFYYVYVSKHTRLLFRVFVYLAGEGKMRLPSEETPAIK